MNQLTQAKRVQVIAALVEGNSVRATCRMTGVCKKAVLKMLVDLGCPFSLTFCQIVALMLPHRSVVGGRLDEVLFAMVFPP